MTNSQMMEIIDGYPATVVVIKDVPDHIKYQVM